MTQEEIAYRVDRLCFNWLYPSVILGFVANMVCAIAAGRVGVLIFTLVAVTIALAGWRENYHALVRTREKYRAQLTPTGETAPVAKE